MGGVFKSTSSGDSWSEANLGLANYFVETFAINPRNSEPTVRRYMGRWCVQEPEWRRQLASRESRIDRRDRAGCAPPSRALETTLCGNRSRRVSTTMGKAGR